MDLQTVRAARDRWEAQHGRRAVRVLLSPVDLSTVALRSHDTTAQGLALDALEWGWSETLPVGEVQFS